MNNSIAYCGLDCAKCDAKIATANNDDELRKKVAKEWSKLNNVEITKEMINCYGCKSDGVKTPFCENMCQIRRCAVSKEFSNCGCCETWKNCDTLKMIINHNADAVDNLKNSFED